MKIPFIRKPLTIISTALALGVMFTFPSMADVVGHLDDEAPNTATGWVWDTESPDKVFEVHVDVTPAGSDTPVISKTVTADKYRPSLVKTTGYSMHGFSVALPWADLEGDEFTITAYVIIDGKNVPYTEILTYKKSTSVTSVKYISDPAYITRYDPYPKGATVTTPDGRTATEKAATAKDAAASQGPGTSKASEEAAESSDAKYVQGESLGTFTATGYCTCNICSGGWGLTYSGTVPQPNHTVSADISVLPIGTKLMINGIVYTVEDIGSSVRGNWIDIYYATHAEAAAYGTKTVEVFAVIEK